jgi:hypothetical protein
MTPKTMTFNIPVRRDKPVPRATMALLRSKLLPSGEVERSDKDVGSPAAVTSFDCISSLFIAVQGRS